MSFLPSTTAVGRPTDSADEPPRIACADAALLGESLVGALAHPPRMATARRREQQSRNASLFTMPSDRRPSALQAAVCARHEERPAGSVRPVALRAGPRQRQRPTQWLSACRLAGCFSWECRASTLQPERQGCQVPRGDRRAARSFPAGAGCSQRAVATRAQTAAGSHLGAIAAWLQGHEGARVGGSLTTPEASRSCAPANPSARGVVARPQSARAAPSSRSRPALRTHTRAAHPRP